MKLVSVPIIAALALALSSSLARASEPASGDCAGPLDFRVIGSWLFDDGLESKSFSPSTRSQTPGGLPVSTETCMAAPQDVEEVASVEIAPHMHTLVESHYHIGFIGLDRMLVTFPNGAIHFLQRVASAPRRVLDAVEHRHGP